MSNKIMNGTYTVRPTTGGKKPVSIAEMVSGLPPAIEIIPEATLRRVADSVMQLADTLNANGGIGGIGRVTQQVFGKLDDEDKYELLHAARLKGYVLRIAPKEEHRPWALEVSLCTMSEKDVASYFDDGKLPTTEVSR